jgi:hypothetical protein
MLKFTKPIKQNNTYTQKKKILNNNLSLTGRGMNKQGKVTDFTFHSMLKGLKKRTTKKDFQHNSDVI